MPVTQEEKITAFGLAKDITGEVINPLNYYRYNPGMYNFTQGRVNMLAINGRNIDRIGKSVGRIPGMSDHVIKMRGFIKRSSFGGILQSKRVSFGLLDANERGTLGFINEGTGRKLGVDLKTYKNENLFGPTGQLRSILSKHKSGVMNYTTRQTLEGRLLIHKQKVMEHIVNKGVPASQSIVAKGIDRTGDKSAKFIGSKFLRRSVVRGGIGIAKGLAYIEAAKLVWGVVNPAFETVGRSAVSGLNSMLNKLESIPTPDLGGQLSMSYLSQGAATERQRALMAISKSQINGRSALGNESQYLHR